MHLKIEKKDSKERLAVSVSGASAAKALAAWLGTANFRVSAEIVFGEDEAPEAAPEPPTAAPARAGKPEPAGEDIKSVREHLARHAGASAKAVAQSTGLAVDKVRGCLAWLVSAGQATQEGSGRGRTYSLAATGA